MPGQWGLRWDFIVVTLQGSMAPARRDCSGWEKFLPAGCLLLSALLFYPSVAKVCNDRTTHGQDNSWFSRDGENLPIMVLMPMNESALMSSISQGIEPAVQLAIQHIRESGNYPFSLITKIYDTEVSMRARVSACRQLCARACASAQPLCVYKERGDKLILVFSVCAYLFLVPVFPLHQSDWQYSTGL